MYSIYVDSKCIYNDISPSKKNQIIKPKLVIEDNSAGSLTFTLPSNNEFTNDVKRIVSTVTVMKDGIEFWSGRVLDEDVDFYNNRTLYCEGELAYFNDSNQPPAEYHDITPRGLLETFVSIHNSQVEANKRFTVGAVTVTDPNDSLYRYTNYESTIEAIKTKLIDVLGGHLRIRKVNGVRYLDYLKDYPQVSTQQIHFGKNLLDFAKNYSMSDFVTVLLPKGAMINGEDYDSTSSYAVGDYCYYSNYIWRCKTAITSSETWNPAHWTRLQKYIPALTPYLTVEEVNNGSMYVVNSEAVNEYGWIVGVKEWDNVTDPNNLLTKAQEYLSKVQYDNLELEVTAVDLRLMDVKYDSLNLLDQIRVVSRPHGINMLFPIRKMEIPLEKPESTSFTLSLKEDTKSTNLSGTTSKSLSDLENNIENASNIHRQAIENVTALLNMSTNGYITILKNQNGTSEMLITDEKDWTRAQRIWRWNINGLGYSNDGGRTYGTAMTMDGSIVADYITSGTMTADRIRGGTLEVGGTGLGVNGKITIKNTNGTVIGSWDKTGIVAERGTIGGFNLNKNYMETYDGTSQSDSLHLTQLNKYNTDGHPAFGIWGRESVNDAWESRVFINHDGNTKIRNKSSNGYLELNGAVIKGGMAGINEARLDFAHDVTLEGVATKAIELRSERNFVLNTETAYVGTNLNTIWRTHTNSALFSLPTNIDDATGTIRNYIQGCIFIHGMLLN